MKDRKTNKVITMPVERANAYNLHEFVQSNLSYYATIYTDEAPACNDLPQVHRTVNHSVGEYVIGQTHINVIENFWCCWSA